MSIIIVQQLYLPSCLSCLKVSLPEKLHPRLLRKKINLVFKKVFRRAHVQVFLIKLTIIILLTDVVMFFLFR